MCTIYNKGRGGLLKRKKPGRHYFKKPEPIVVPDCIEEVSLDSISETMELLKELELEESCICCPD